MHRPLQVLDRRLDRQSRAPVAVAFSGGSDSLALLLLAKAWADQAGRPLLALTVDHGLQPQSAAWTRAAAGAAERLGVGFRALEWRGEKPAAGRPAAARSARHRLIAEAARDAGASAVLVGHTLDDQFENALMRAEGERLGRLCEWSPSPVWPEGRGLFHLRPLLAERRADLRAWLRDQAQDWIEDPANADPRSPRARARQRIADGEEPSRFETDEPGEDLSRDWTEGWRVTAWGGIVVSRTAFAQAGSLRLLQIACACASGREALGRPERARGLLRRLQAGETFTATLGGVRLQAADEVLITREAGEFARTGGGPLMLQPGRPRVWDGRFELLARGRGYTARPLRGLASRLNPEQKEKLGLVPSAGRGALPAVQGEGNGASCPVLDDAGGAGAVIAHGLVGNRFKAALGLIRRERESSMSLRMADCAQSSYVGAEAKGLFE